MIEFILSILPHSIILAVSGIIVFLLFSFLFREKPPRYCSKCGSLLNLTKMSNGFNEKTGKQLFKRRYTCPNYRLDGSDNPHTDFWE